MRISNISNISFSGRKKHTVEPIKGQVTFEELYNDTFQKSPQMWPFCEDRKTPPAKTQKIETSSAKAPTKQTVALKVKPKDIVISKANEFLKTEGQELLYSSIDVNERAKILENTLKSTAYFEFPVKNETILKDGILIQLLKNLNPNDKFRGFVVNKLVKREIKQSQKYVKFADLSGAEKNISKNYYTRISMISKALVEEVTDDKKSITKLLQEDKSKIPFKSTTDYKKQTLKGLYEFFVRNNVTKEEKIKPVVKKLTDYKSVLDECSQDGEIQALSTALDTTIKKLPKLIKH